MEFLLTPDDRRKEEAIAAVQHELDYYLVEPGELDPWAYAVYHTGTLANLYSPVHWNWITPEETGRPETDPKAP